MASAVHPPLLGHYLALRVAVQAAGAAAVAVEAGLLVDAHRRGAMGGRDAFAVAGMDRRIGVAMEDDMRTADRAVTAALPLSRPCMAGSAPAKSGAAPAGSPEWTPAAAKTSGWVVARMAAIAPPADRPAT